ncbi:Protein SCAI, partial [Ophiophagus hannah]
MSMCGIDDDIPQGERKTVTDFCYLLDKSKQLFNGLRFYQAWKDEYNGSISEYVPPAVTSPLLPEICPNTGRSSGNLISAGPLIQVLDNRYGLKRWQIGEIASKIGQLYYHYYLRTSETSYLNEAFSFYSAIRQRSYYSQVNKEDRPELVVKKLRYYARFIVVCLLLNKMVVVKDLELSDEIEDYTHRFNTEDQVEWNLVLQEVAAFIEADPVMVLNDDNTLVILSNRLSETGAPLLEQGMIVGQLTLADALIIRNCNNQESTEKPARRENPHKYLLYKPTFSQLYTFLAASFKVCEAEVRLVPSSDRRLNLTYPSLEAVISSVKFSELTIDMFRMLQALEREPMNLATQMNKPGLQASLSHELPANSVLLIYLSATGVFPSGRSDSEGTNKGMLPVVNRA